MSNASPAAAIKQRPFGMTYRTDAWWIPSLLTFLGFSAFIIYSTWAAFQNAHYTWGPYLSPFYAPELWGDSPHAWFGPKPAWWPSFAPFSPALLILWAPGGFRFTCYYYRGAYYKAFWADPPGCAVGEPRKSYLGEAKFPLIFQNIHRYFWYLAAIFIVMLAYDAVEAFRWDDGMGGHKFGIGVGSIVMTVNVCLLASYTFGCHSARHLFGGILDRISASKPRSVVYGCSSCLNRRHMLFAWLSLFSVGLTDVYVRLCSMGVITDWRIF